MSVEHLMQPPLRALVVIALPAALLLAACGDDSSDASGSPSTIAESIDGRTYLSTLVTGAVLVDSTQISLTFDGPQLSASAGCNMMSGEFVIDDGVLTLAGAGLAQTEMGCAPALMEQDAWVARLLSSGPSVIPTADGITVSGGGIEVVLTDRRIADPDRPLDGTVWTVNSVITDDAVASTPTGATLVFADGAVQFDSGCNNGSATAVAGPGTVTIGPIALTKMACAPDVMALESAMLAALAGDVGVQIEASTLTLTGPDGNGLVLTAGA